MGKIEWAAYRPEDINWGARANVDEWTMEDEKVSLDKEQQIRIKLSAISGFLFFILMLLLLSWTYLWSR